MGIYFAGFDALNSIFAVPATLCSSAVCECISSAWHLGEAAERGGNARFASQRSKGIAQQWWLNIRLIDHKYLP